MTVDQHIVEFDMSVDSKDF